MTTVRFEQLMYSVYEGHGPARAVLVLSNPSVYDITAEVLTVGGLATGEYVLCKITCA